jgi:hypothetical protein
MRAGSLMTMVASSAPGPCKKKRRDVPLVLLARARHLLYREHAPRVAIGIF